MYGRRSTQYAALAALLLLVVAVSVLMPTPPLSSSATSTVTSLSSVPLSSLSQPPPPSLTPLPPPPLPPASGGDNAPAATVAPLSKQARMLLSSVNCSDATVGFHRRQSYAVNASSTAVCTYRNLIVYKREVWFVVADSVPLDAAGAAVDGAVTDPHHHGGSIPYVHASVQCDPWDLKNLFRPRRVHVHVVLRLLRRRQRRRQAVIERSGTAAADDTSVVAAVAEEHAHAVVFYRMNPLNYYHHLFEDLMGAWRLVCRAAGAAATPAAFATCVRDRRVRQRTKLVFLDDWHENFARAAWWHQWRWMSDAAPFVVPDRRRNATTPATEPLLLLRSAWVGSECACAHPVACVFPFERHVPGVVRQRALDTFRAESSTTFLPASASPSSSVSDTASPAPAAVTSLSIDNNDSDDDARQSAALTALLDRVATASVTTAERRYGVDTQEPLSLQLSASVAAAAAQLRRFIADHAIDVGTGHTRGPLRVLLVQRSHSRTIVNTPEVLRYLRAIGAEPRVAYMETLSDAEQAMLYHEHDVVLAMHGGGMANSLFVRRGALYVDMRPGHYIHQLVQGVAQSLRPVGSCFMTLELQQHDSVPDWPYVKARDEWSTLTPRERRAYIQHRTCPWRLRAFCGYVSFTPGSRHRLNVTDVHVLLRRYVTTTLARSSSASALVSASSPRRFHSHAHDDATLCTAGDSMPSIPEYVNVWATPTPPSTRPWMRATPRDEDGVLTFSGAMPS